jgi:hypothetical protein
MKFVTCWFAVAMLHAADANLLQTGRFLYRTTIDGKDAGASEITIGRPEGSNFVFTNHVTGAFVQQWEAIAGANFVPVSAKLTFGDGRAGFELNYRNGRVTGFKGPKTVDAEVPPDTVDQRIDWAAAMARDLSAGSEFAFHVYDPGTGLSPVTGKISGPESIHVPAGTFEAMRIVYRIDKAGRPEVYQVLTKRSGLRMLLKEEFPDGAVTELLEIH